MATGSRPPWVPGHIAADIDTTELAPPDQRHEHLAAELEHNFGCRIALYRPDAIGTPGGLCHHYPAAQLDHRQIQRLRQVEEQLDLVLVAYGPPV